MQRDRSKTKSNKNRKHNVKKEKRPKKTQHLLLNKNKIVTNKDTNVVFYEGTIVLFKKKKL